MGLFALKIGLSVFSAISSNKRARKAAKQAAEQQERLQDLQDEYANLDTSNPYLNIENVYEDLTINQQQANFLRQTQAQARANILDRLRQSAGPSGIASLAQTLANQGSIDAQKASVSIAQQERQNELLRVKEEQRIQGLEREGELISRQAEFDIIEGQMGLTADQLDVARDLEARNRQQTRAAFAQGITAVGEGISTGAFDAGFKDGGFEGTYAQYLGQEGVDAQGFGSGLTNQFGVGGGGFSGTYDWTGGSSSGGGAPQIGQTAVWDGTQWVKQ